MNCSHNSSLDATVKAYSRYRTRNAAGEWCQCPVKARGTGAQLLKSTHTHFKTNTIETQAGVGPDLSPAKAVAAAKARCVLTEWKPDTQRHLCVHVDHAAFSFSFRSSPPSQSI